MRSVYINSHFGLIYLAEILAKTDPHSSISHGISMTSMSLMYFASPYWVSYSVFDTTDTIVT